MKGWPTIERVTIQIPLDNKLGEKQGQVSPERGKNCTTCSASLTQKLAHHYRYKDSGKNRQVCNFLCTCWNLQIFPSVFTRSHILVLPVLRPFGKLISVSRILTGLSVWGFSWKSFLHRDGARTVVYS